MYRFYRGSLALRVLVISILLFALPLLIYFLVVLRQNYDQRLRTTAVRLYDLGESRAAILEQATEFSFQTIDVIQQFLLSGEVPSKRLTGILTGVAKGSQVSRAFYTQIDGNRYTITASSDPTMIGGNMGQYHFVSEVLIHGQSIYLSANTPNFESTLFVAKIVRDADGKAIGILTMATPLESLIQEMVREEETTYPVNFSVLDQAGTIFASGDDELVLQRAYTPDEKELITSGKASVEIVPIRGVPHAGRMSVDGVTSIAVIVPIEETPFTLLLNAKEKDVFGEQRMRLIHVLSFFLLIFLVGGWVALWVTQKMSVPWRQLGQTMTSVSRGDLTARFHAHRMGFEINSLGQIFNETIDSLSDQMAQAEAERVQKETLRKELQIGQEIQLAILPQAQPELPGVDLAARYLPAKEVGGDFYDVYVRRMEDGTAADLVLTVADAAGKGISACLYSLGLRSMLRSFCASGRGVSTSLVHTNNLFCEDTRETGMFVTALTAIYDPTTRQLTYASCGHNPGLISRASGKVEPLEGGGLAMGVELFTSLPEKQVELHEGDLVILYTDGVTESQNAEGAFYGLERLTTLLAANPGLSADATADQILEDVSAFRGIAPPFDDITLLAMRVTP